MKLIILALFSLILIVRSEDKTENKAEDQKNEDSAPYERYGSGYSQNDDSLRYDNGFYYNNGYGRGNGEEKDGRGRGYGGQSYYNDDEEEEYYKNDGRSKNVGEQSYDYNAYNEGGYPKNDGGYPKNEGGYPRNEGGYPGNEGGYPKNEGGYPGNEGGYPKNEGGYPGNEGGYPKNEGGYPRNDGEYGGKYDGRYKNGGSNDVQLEPKHIGYVGSKHSDKDGYYYRLIGRIGLGFDKRTATSYGLRAPITPELLQVVGKFHPKRYFQPYYYKD